MKFAVKKFGGGLPSRLALFAIKWRRNPPGSRRADTDGREGELTICALLNSSGFEFDRGRKACFTEMHIRRHM